MSYPKLQGLSDEAQKRLELCCVEIQEIAVCHFPELRGLYGNELQDRIFMTMYFELIHMGYFKENKNA
jgi:hypothetical protein